MKTAVIGQTAEQRYNAIIKRADNLYRVKNYKNAGLTYAQAIKLFNGQVTVNDRFNAACAWALAEVPDSAFAQLQIIAAKNNYSNFQQISNEHDLTILHKDKRWKPVLELIKQNIAKIEAKLNLPLKYRLDSIYREDQILREQLDEVEQKYGAQSKELEQLWDKITYRDSLNLIQVEAILDSFGCPGSDIVGEKGNATLFLVIQHSNQKAQEKYLPMMRDAVKKGNASASELALLEDRIAIGQGRKQIYGSQLSRDNKTGKWVIDPIEDPEHVNKRRADVGLEPLEVYARYFGIEMKSKSVINESTAKCLHMDFATAIEIQDSIVKVDKVCMGFGSLLEFNMTSVYNEENSTWFKLTLPFDTILTFDIVPEYFKEDYDFILFKCSDTNCISDLKANHIKPERLCFSNNQEKYGSTGLSLYENQKVVGAGGGLPGYVSALPVKKGEVYYLMVNFAVTNYAKTPLGFTIYLYNYWPKKPDYLKQVDPLKIYLVIDNILFESNQALLSKKSKQALDGLAKQLLENKTTHIAITGYTDNVGDDSTNQVLSEERANAIADYLVSKGVEKIRLSCKGLGSKQPLASNTTEVGRKQNRRVEFRVLKYH